MPRESEPSPETNNPNTPKSNSLGDVAEAVATPLPAATPTPDPAAMTPNAATPVAYRTRSPRRTRSEDTASAKQLTQKVVAAAVSSPSPPAPTAADAVSPPTLATSLAVPLAPPTAVPSTQRQSPRGARTGASRPTGQGRSRSIEQLGEGIAEQSSPEAFAGLIDTGEEYWARQTAQARAEYVNQIHKIYWDIVDEFFDEANACVDQYLVLDSRYKSWRIVFFILAGILAVGNVVIASMSEDNLKHNNWLPVTAAAFAAAIGVFSNIEGFLKYLERTQAYRQARDVFLDAYRHFEMLWLTHIGPSAAGPDACVNASRLHQQISAKDQELRRMVRQLTAAEKK